MIEKKHAELIHKDVDGFTSSQEKAELERCLAGNPEARDLHRDLSRVGTLLGQIPPAEPPEDLKREIMARICARSVPEPAPSRPLLGFVNGLSPRFRYPLVFASGLAAGVLLFLLAAYFPRLNFGGDAERMSGTMLPEFSSPSPAPLAESEIRRTDVTGQIRWYRDANRIEARIDLRPARPVQLTLRYDDQGAMFTGLAWLTPPSADALFLSKGAVRLSVSGNSSCRVTFLPLRPGNLPFSVKVAAAGRVFFEKGFELK